MKHAWFSPNPFDRVTQLMPQMREIEAAHIAQLDAFELCPQALARVQFGGIRREALQVNSSRGAMRQELLDDVTAVNGGAIPDDDQAAGNLAQEVLQKGDDITRVHRVILHMEVEFALGRDGTDRGEMIPGIPFLQNWGLAHRGIGAHDTGEWIKPRFVYEDNRLLLGLRPPLMAGQVSSRQRAMAASSRWRARRAGFCGLQPIALSRRPT